MSGERRLRRLRRSPALRELRRETRLVAANFVLPLFVAEDPTLAGPIEAMPGVRRHALGELAAVGERVVEAGVPAVLIFGVPAAKHPDGHGAAAPDGVVCRAIDRLRSAAPSLALIADVCLCAYTDHGHCGVVRGAEIDNDSTLPLLAEAAVAYGHAGADLVAPSAMMDGMVGAIRAALDRSEQPQTAILSYTVKYASAFYGPFREAVASAPRSGDRKSHQMHPANAREALAEAAADVAKGADLLMVKPGLPYLDIIRRLREGFPDVPLAAYQVSGEYSQLQAAAARGWLDLRPAALESLLALKRAGADLIITYFAEEAAQWLREI